jgi:hypothetical protein
MKGSQSTHLIVFSYLSVALLSPACLRLKHQVLIANICVLNAQLFNKLSTPQVGGQFIIHYKVRGKTKVCVHGGNMVVESKFSDRLWL